MPKSKCNGWPPSGFGPRLRELREGKGLSQGQLAQVAGCNVFTVSKTERGTQEPAWPLVLALARALGVEVGAFVVNGEQAEAEPVPMGRLRKAPAATQELSATGEATAEPTRREKPAAGQKLKRKG